MVSFENFKLTKELDQSGNTAFETLELMFVYEFGMKTVLSKLFARAEAHASLPDSSET